MNEMDCMISCFEVLFLHIFGDSSAWDPATTATARMTSSRERCSSSWASRRKTRMYVIYYIYSLKYACDLF